MLPGPAVPGCSLVSFHFLWEILCPQAVTVLNFTVFLINHIACMSLVRGFCNFVWFSILHLRKQQTKLMNDRLPHTRWLIWSTSLYERDRVIPRSPSPNWLRFLSLSLSLSLLILLARSPQTFGIPSHRAVLEHPSSLLDHLRVPDCGGAAEQAKGTHAAAGAKIGPPESD